MSRSLTESELVRLALGFEMELDAYGGKIQSGDWLAGVIGLGWVGLKHGWVPMERFLCELRI